MFRAFAAVVCLVLLPTVSPAAVLVLANRTGQELPFWFKGEGEATLEKLANGESRAFRCGDTADVTYHDGAADTAARLDGYTAYVFTRKGTKTELTGIELPGKAPAIGKAANGEPVTIPVKLLADDTERRTRPVWEAAVRKRFADAAAVVTAHTGVKFEVVAVEEWESAPAAADMKGLLADFEKRVEAKPARLVIGFTARTFAPKPGGVAFFDPGLSASRGGLGSHLLVRSHEPRHEVERVEVLTGQLGRYLGAVACPDPISAMRPRLGDGKAISNKFRIGFDPLNVLAMNVWAEHLPDARVRSAAALPDEAQLRLARIYAVLAEAAPDEPLPEGYAGLIERAGLQPVVEAKVPVKPGDPAPKPVPTAKDLSPKEAAVRKVVRAVAAAANANPKSPRGDERTALLVKAAAEAALPLDADLRAPGFLIGIGIALDDSTILRDNPVTQTLCRAVESDEERRQRVLVLGNPTVRFRRDLCQHFVVSAALAEVAGPAMAEQLGLAKEMLDMTRPSGFSFPDLAADLSGVAFAARVQKDAAVLAATAGGFKVSDHVPDMDGLADGLTKEKFTEKYGGLQDARYKAAMDELRRRVKEMPANGK